MPIIDKNNKEQLKKYEEYVKSIEDTHFIQDPRWSKVHTNLKAEFVTVEENNKIIISATVYIRPIAFNRTLLYVNRGPVTKKHDKESLLKIIKELTPLIKKYNSFAVRFDPNWKYDEKLINEIKDKNFNIRGKNISKKYLVMSRKTMSFKLKGRTIDELLKMFKANTRRDINKSLRSGLTIKTGFTKEHLDEFMKILDITCQRQKITLRPRSFYEKISENFTDNEARLYLVKKDNEYLSGSICMNYAGRVFYYYSGSTNKERNLCPNAFMQYNLIKWAVETNAHTYDMGGIIKEDISDGLYLFKTGYCNEEGIEEYIGEIDYIIKPIEYKIFLIAYKLMQDYRTWKIEKSFKK